MVFGLEYLCRENALEMERYARNLSKILILVMPYTTTGAFNCISLTMADSKKRVHVK